jgi:hypothetical protein
MLIEFLLSRFFSKSNCVLRYRPCGATCEGIVDLVYGSLSLYNSREGASGNLKPLMMVELAAVFCAVHFIDLSNYTDILELPCILWRILLSCLASRFVVDCFINTIDLSA